ncbi:MAG: hypothetical protein HY260_12810 [Chloroflexi bacterium]|nr:hypothetical protein [Chloroflexota bacterium]
MRTNQTKRKLQSGQTALGCWLTLGSPRAARALAAGTTFDWVMIDLEHNPIDREAMAACVLAVADGSAGRTAPMVRVPDLSPGHVKQALDAGAYGILAPMVMGAADVAAFVENCLYPPKGIRGVYGGAAFNYTFNPAPGEYFKTASDEILIAVQIETRPALAEVDAIAAIEGLDMLFVGPNDLHATLGLQPRYESDEPAFVAALDSVVAACRKHGKAAGILSANPEMASRMIAKGFGFVGIGNDAGHMVNAAKAVLAQVAT